MQILKKLHRIDELDAKALEKERYELQRREALLKRLNTSRYNNTKLFGIQIKGE